MLLNKQLAAAKREAGLTSVVMRLQLGSLGRQNGGMIASKFSAC